MRALPVTKEVILTLAAVVFVPIVPLMLTIMPLEDLLNKLFGIVF